MPSPTPLRALLFDFDGLMVDTETAIYQAWQEIYASHGQELPLATYVHCVGSHAHDYDPGRALDELLGKSLDWTALMKQQSLRVRELHQGLGPFPGIRELLTEANEAGVACAVASSSNAQWVNGWLERLNLKHHFQAIITRDLVQRAKPAPDLFLLAMERLGSTGADSLVLEDSQNGLKAAIAADVPCVIVPNTVTDGLDFSLADAVIPTLAGLQIADLAALRKR